MSTTSSSGKAPAKKVAPKAAASSTDAGSTPAPDATTTGPTTESTASVDSAGKTAADAAVDASPSPDAAAVAAAAAIGAEQTHEDIPPDPDVDPAAEAVRQQPQLAQNVADAAKAVTQEKRRRDRPRSSQLGGLVGNPEANKPAGTLPSTSPLVESARKAASKRGAGGTVTMYGVNGAEFDVDPTLPHIERQIAAGELLERNPLG